VENRLGSALELSGQPVKRGTMAHEHIVYMMLVDSAVRAGDEAAIRKYLPALQALAERDAHRPYLAVAHRAEGVTHRLAGEFEQAGERLHAALEIFEQLGTLWQIGRTLLELGELELARSDSEAAEGYFARALAAFERLGAQPDIERVKAAQTQMA
jgi:tetratricopeptide (TPR) repeat protein